MTDHTAVEYCNIAKIIGPLVFIDRVIDVGFDELVEIHDAEGNARLGTVLDVSDERAVVQVLEGTSGLTATRSRGSPIPDTSRSPGMPLNSADPETQA